MAKLSNFDAGVLVYSKVQKKKNKKKIKKIKKKKKNAYFSIYNNVKVVLILRQPTTNQIYMFRLDKAL